MTKKKKKRKFNLRHISQQRCYSYAEAAELLDRTAHTIGMWRSWGWLKTIDDTKPLLIHGSELYACCKRINDSFLKGAAKEGEIYCFGCKKNHLPKDSTVELSNIEGQLTLIGYCAEKGTKMRRPIKEKDIFIFSQHLTIHQPEGETRSSCPQSGYHQPISKEGKS